MYLLFLNCVYLVMLLHVLTLKYLIILFSLYKVNEKEKERERGQDYGMTFHVYFIIFSLPRLRRENLKKLLQRI